MHYAKIYLIELAIVYAIYEAYQLYFFFTNKKPFILLVIQISTILTLILIGIINYLLAKRFLIVALHFSNVQSILLVLFIFEGTIYAKEKIENVDGLLADMTLLATTSISSYNQVTLLISYICYSVYLIGRTYLWIGNLIRYLKFNSYFIASFAFIYVSARFYH